MDISSKKEFDLYKDIQNRTDGEVYLGIVGPVRTGKSTFIKRFMTLWYFPIWKMYIAGSARLMNYPSLHREKPS